MSKKTARSFDANFIVAFDFSTKFTSISAYTKTSNVKFLNNLIYQQYCCVFRRYFYMGTKNYCVALPFFPSFLVSTPYPNCKRREFNCHKLWFVQKVVAEIAEFFGQKVPGKRALNDSKKRPFRQRLSNFCTVFPTFLLRCTNVSRTQSQ